jgi:glucokinase
MAAKKKTLSVGVDLGGTNVRAGLVNSQKILKLQAKNVRSLGTENEVFDDLCHVIDAVFDDRVGSLGVGVPSLVNLKDGTIFDTTNIPSWKHVPLKKRLEKRYKVPVRLDNDANCFALGEKRFGAAKRADNFVGLVLGTGLGAGIVSGGELHSGLHCGAGEFGLIPYRDSILEHYASGQFFRRQDLDGAALAEAAERGDKDALSLFREFGHHVGHAIQLILYSVAPEMIVLGGSVSRSLPYFESSMTESLKNFAYPTLLKQLQIKTSRLKDVAVLGAASL